MKPSSKAIIAVIFAVMSAALLALIIFLSHYATIGWQYTHTKRPLAPLYAKLHEPLPACPGTKFSEGRNEEERLGCDISPYDELPGQERYSICAKRTYFRIDASELYTKTGHRGTDQIERYYVDYLKSCGLRFGAEYGGTGGTVLEGWSGTGVGSKVDCFAYVCVRPDTTQ